MIMPLQMQHTMHGEMSQMIRQALVLLLRFGSSDVGADQDITEHTVLQLQMFRQRERQHIGGLVALAIAPVEIVDFCCFDQADGQRGSAV